MQFGQCVVVFLLLFLVSCSNCQSYTDSVDLVSDVLEGYDTRQRPVLVQTHPIYVSMNFHLLTLQDFDEVAEKFSVYGLLWMTWTDQIITWNPAEFGGLHSAIFKLSDVWYPKLVLIKPYSKLKDLGDDWMIVRIFSSGYTSFVPGAVFEATCSVDVTYYPFDTQNCTLAFNVWGYVGYEVVLLPIDSTVNTDSFTESGEWSLVSTSVNRVAGDIYRSDEIHFNFILKRKPSFLVINVILPIIFMAVINLLVFVLPAESGERVSYSVTVLLALAVFMTLVGDNLPKTSEPMSVLSYYLMCLLILSTLMTVTTIFNLKIYHKKSQAPACVKSFVRILNCVPCRFRKKFLTQKNKVSPKEVSNIKSITVQAKVSQQNTDLTQSEEPEITWESVSLVVDRISLVVFFIATIVVNAVFLVILAENKSVAF